MRTDVWVSRHVDLFWEEFGRQRQPAAQPIRTWERLSDQSDVAYFCFAQLRHSDADRDELAADAAWACWRLRRLMRVSSCSTSVSVATRVRLRARWLALNVRRRGMARRDIVIARLVVVIMRQLLAGVESCMNHLNDPHQLDAMSRRRAELAEVAGRAELVGALPPDAGAPLSERFLQRRG